MRPVVLTNARVRGVIPNIDTNGKQILSFDCRARSVYEGGSLSGALRKPTGHALLVLGNADTDWAKNLVCARHLLNIHLELARVLPVTFRVRRGKASS